MVSNMDKETLMKSGIIVAMVKRLWGQGVMKLADLDGPHRSLRCTRSWPY